ncbi:aldose epimerase family protein [Membranihabitans marinus]|uniref:aldose epimerase family protein n=1 Tax=Membranihabitans marinus TaxID=1227546 RepID=UPI001F28618D|nr:aldose epimerase family protein [Membranihabitans marinus]
MEIKKFVLENDLAKFTFINLGARWIGAEIADIDGNKVDVLQAYENLEDFANITNAYGAICGRVANRIAGASFTLNGKTYNLSENVPGASLHGGVEGFQTKQWDVVSHTDDKIIFTYASPDGDAGYPGNAQIKVTYRIDGQALHLDLEAETDQPCPINLASHPYFNLAGHDAGNVDSHVFQINSDEILAMNQYLVVSENASPVVDTVFDLRQPKSIRQGLISDDEQIVLAGGYDHNYILKDYSKGKLLLAATVKENNSGRFLKIHTTLPGLQFYTCNSNNPNPAKDGVKYQKWGSFCMEPQFFPNSPNIPSFPNTIVKPGEKMSEKVVFEFGQGE